jgi:hypothetical protein
LVELPHPPSARIPSAMTTRVLSMAKHYPIRGSIRKLGKNAGRSDADGA